MKEPSRLGRGLASLLGETVQATAATEPAGSTAVDDLEPNPFQPRTAIDDEDLAELVASIREQGLLQPVLIRRHPSTPGRYQIVAGERRWRAARLAGLATIPSLLRDLSDDAASAAALVENLQRQDLNPIEEAEGLKRLVERFSITQDELARTIGKSRSYVANTIRLLHLPSGVIDHVRKGTLSAGHARAALACADPLAAAQIMVDHGLNVRQAEALATTHSAGEPASVGVVGQEGHGDADLRAVEADLAATLGLKVAISFDGRGGRISLRYRTLDQLDNIVARLGRP